MDPTCCGSAAPPGLTVQVCFPGARAAVLDNLNRQREEGRLCDLSIQVQGQVFRAHRCVLAASSPYFHDQVLLKNVTTVSLPSVLDPVVFQSVLTSAYTGQLSIVHEDIVNYVTVASFLQMWHIVDKCTEILKRPRPSADSAPAPPGSAPRQQSPSSTDCLYAEREARRRDRRPDALPPLATWRRPQQLARWGRPRPPSDLQSADSQLDLQNYVDSRDFSCCQEAWPSSQAKSSSSGPDGAGQNSRHQGPGHAAEASKLKVRLQQRGAERPLDKTRDRDQTRDRRKDKRGAQADGGGGDKEEEEEEEEERKEGGTQMDFLPPDPEERLSGRQSVEKVQRGPVGGDPSSDPPGPAEGPSVSGRVQWQTGPWSQSEQRPQVGDEEEEVDFECLTDFSRDTFEEIEDGTGQVSQRSLVSPDFSLGGSDGTWTSSGGGPVTPSPAAFPPPPSPPTPSSSSASVSGPAYSGKVHFCHCGKAYTLKSMRDRHVKMQHLNLRPFVCPVCSKSFKMKHHLTKHLKTHGGLRPYECSVCGKKVVWRDSFLRHQTRCQRLASTAAAATPDGYGFQDGELFVPAGTVKVEDGDIRRDSRGAGLMDNGSGMAGTPSQNLDSVSPVFKEEAAESF
ncbi:zinc finger and BTB domain-containing protein 22 [Austrofundulus limnaeus]|uniref:Zinc finger and BTB domain-containing protein 22 n=1 Tax=Austrofundulus limnaeus TaxID=52670 RepID=A0A2I4CM99_AUSLI|nr:PREDICTED: zinc finger and BTB domain-containing protein 22-like [Austrofundulus limnaeus]